MITSETLSTIKKVDTPDLRKTEAIDENIVLTIEITIALRPFK
jgi:hypothetical protein